MDDTFILPEVVRARLVEAYGTYKTAEQRYTQLLEVAVSMAGFDPKDPNLNLNLETGVFSHRELPQTMESSG